MHINHDTYNTVKIVLLKDEDGDGITDKTVTVAEGAFTHGIRIQSGYLYASSDSTVWRWPYDDDSYTDGGDAIEPLTVYNAETVIQNMNADGKGGAPLGHTTRTAPSRKT